MTKTERAQMILDLTQYELTWLSDNPEHKEATAAFFANGGFAQYSDDELLDQHSRLTA